MSSRARSPHRKRWLPLSFLPCYFACHQTAWTRANAALGQANAAALRGCHAPLAECPPPRAGRQVELSNIRLWLLGQLQMLSTTPPSQPLPGTGSTAGTQQAVSMAIMCELTLWLMYPPIIARFFNHCSVSEEGMPNNTASWHQVACNTQNGHQQELPCL